MIHSGVGGLTAPKGPRLRLSRCTDFVLGLVSPSEPEMIPIFPAAAILASVSGPQTVRPSARAEIDVPDITSAIV